MQTEDIKQNVGIDAQQAPAGAAPAAADAAAPAPAAQEPNAEQVYDGMSIEQLELHLQEEDAKAQKQGEPAAPAPQNTPNLPKKTPITPEMRSELNIPEKFKFIEDVAKSYSEAEREGARIKNEKDRIERESVELKSRLAQHEVELAELKKSTAKQVQSGDMTAEERKQLVEQFELEWETDKVGTLNRILAGHETSISERLPAIVRGVLEKIDAERQAQESQRRYVSEREAEMAELKQKYENFDLDLLPEIKRIAQERPYLKTIKEALAIVQLEREADRKQTELKQADKRAAFSESGSGTAPAAGRGNIVDEINNANTLEELEKIASKM